MSQQVLAYLMMLHFELMGHINSVLEYLKTLHLNRYFGNKDK